MRIEAAGSDGLAAHHAQTDEDRPDRGGSTGSHSQRRSVCAAAGPQSARHAHRPARRAHALQAAIHVNRHIRVGIVNLYPPGFPGGRRPLAEPLRLFGIHSGWVSPGSCRVVPNGEYGSSSSTGSRCGPANRSNRPQIVRLPVLCSLWPFREPVGFIVLNTCAARQVITKELPTPSPNRRPPAPPSPQRPAARRADAPR